MENKYNMKSPGKVSRSLLITRCVASAVTKPVMLLFVYFSY